MLSLSVFYVRFLDFVMSSLFPSCSIFGFDVDPTDVLFTVVSIPVVAFAYPVSVYFTTRWRLESEYKSAILMSESLLPILKKREGPQAQNVTPSVEYAVSIARFLMSASAALLELDNNFPWRTPKVRKALFTAKNDTTVMLRLRDAAAERFFESTDDASLTPNED